LEEVMKKSLLIAAVSVLALSAPAFAEDVGVGVGVGPVGAGVTVGAGHDHYRDRDHDRTTVIHEREPRDKTVVNKKEHPQVERKTIIHEHD
jgi:opacity protein-like surface antigen